MKTIINVALTGMVPNKNMTPHVPVTPEEIANQAKECLDIGATMFHIHARDEFGVPTTDKEIYREIIDRIRNYSQDVVIIVTTSGRNVQDFEQRAEVLELEGDHKPDMASITMGSMNFMAGASLNSPEWLMYLSSRLQETDVAPEVEVFHDGMLNYLRYFIRKGWMKPNPYINMIFGNLGTIQADRRHVHHMYLDKYGEGTTNSPWGVSGLGQFAEDIIPLGLALESHLRVGIEDSIYMDKEKKELATNLKLVERAVIMCESMGRQIATPQETREILGL